MSLMITPDGVSGERRSKEIAKIGIVHYRMRDVCGETASPRILEVFLM